MKVCAVLLSVALAAAQGVAAQGDHAIRGVVTDASGAAMPQAKLTLSGPAQMASTSGADGSYVFEGIPAGVYLLRAEAASMTPEEKEVKLSFLDAVIRFQLKPAAKAESVTIAAATSRLEEEAVGSDRNADRLNFDEDTLASLPAPAQNPLGAVAGFASAAAQGAEGLNITVDGMEASASSLTGQSIRRIRINRNPYSLQFRRPGKARIEVYTEEPSTRRYKGTFGLAVRDSVFDARNAFAPVRPDLRRTLADLSIGGPLVGRRTTFFLNGEHYRNNENAVVNAQLLAGPFLANVPVPEQRTRFLGRLEDRGETRTRLLLFSYTDENESNRGVGGLKLPSQGVASSVKSYRTQFSDRGLIAGKVLNDFRVVMTREEATRGLLPTGPAWVVHGAFTGGSAQTFRNRAETTVRLQNISSVGTGSHALRFGIEARPAFYHSLEGSNFGGTYEFANLAAFARNLPFLLRINQGDPNVALRQHEAFGFAQDEWRASPSLSLTYGIRYSWQSDVAGRNSLAPRAGFAWTLSPRTVVRGGAGIFHERVTEDIRRRNLLWDGIRLRELVTNGATTANNTVWQPSDLVLPRLTQASITLERELIKRVTLSSEYQHLRGNNLLRARNISTAPFTHQVESTARLRSDALAMTLRGAWGKWFSSMVQYTLSRTSDDTGGPFAFPANSRNLAAEWGRSDYDNRHRLQAAATFDFFRGYRAGLIVSAASGAPYDVTTGRDDNGDSQVTDRPVGTTRNTGQGPGWFTTDLRLSKSFRAPRIVDRIGSSRNVDLNLDAFNLLNRTNYATFVGVITSPFFGRPNQALAPRTVQISLRYRF